MSLLSGVEGAIDPTTRTNLVVTALAEPLRTRNLASTNSHSKGRCSMAIYREYCGREIRPDRLRSRDWMFTRSEG